MIYLASYKHHKQVTSLKTLYYAIADSLTRKITRGKYSHCEIAIKRKDGKYDCYSSSIRDGGVRHKIMSLPADKWDLQPISHVSNDDVISYYQSTKEQKYDVLGAVGIVLSIKQDSSKSFCSEWCYNLIYRSSDGWRFSPSQLFAIVTAHQAVFLRQNKDKKC